MFKPFDRQLLDALLRKHPVTPTGLEYIERGLAAPSRNVQGTTKNMIGGIVNPKMGFVTQAESHSVERRFVLHYTFSEDCLGFTTQPPPVDLKYQGRNGRNVRTPYTPDALAFDIHKGIEVAEWKPASDRDHFEEKYPGRYYQRTDGSWGSAPAEAVFRPMGINFELRFDDEIPQLVTENQAYLYTYLTPKAEGLFLPRLPELTIHFKERFQRTFGGLVEEGVDKDVINWALATGRLHFDPNSISLSKNAPAVQIFLHRSACEAWRLAVRPNGSRPQTHIDILDLGICVGDVFSLDGSRLTTRFAGNTGVIARMDSGDSVSLSFADLEVAFKANKLTLPARLGEAPVRSRFYSATPAALQRAIRALRILEATDAGSVLPPEDQYSSTTIRGWRRKVAEGLAMGQSPVESLINDMQYRGFRGSHVDATLSADINQKIVDHLKDGLVQSGRTTFGTIKAEIEASGRQMIAQSSFYERLKKLTTAKTIAASMGHKAGYQVETAHWIVGMRTPDHGTHSLQWLHLDSTLLDVEVRSSMSGAVLGRPWLTLATCAYSRRVCGYHLSFRPPSYVSSMMTLADVVRRCGRLPDSVIHDWGSEFKAKDFKDALAALAISRYVRPKSAPRFGSLIERMVGTTTIELIAQIAGNTKLRKNVRQLSPGADPSRHSGLWLLDLQLGLENYFFNIYNDRKHPATLFKPDERFELSFVQHGARLHRMRRLEDILPVILPYARGSARLLDPARGLYVNYRHYSHEALTDRGLDGAAFLVKPIPFDPGLILAFVGNRWTVCRSQISKELEGAPEVVRRCLYEEWSIEQQLVAAARSSSLDKTVELIQKMNQRALENKEYWREREFKEVLASAVFPSQEKQHVSMPPQDSSALAKLTSSMEEAVRTALASRSVGQLVRTGSQEAGNV
jgi:putative transposase